MNDTVTSHNIDLSSWDILYMHILKPEILRPWLLNLWEATYSRGINEFSVIIERTDE
jgi:hypothetical protein